MFCGFGRAFTAGWEDEQTRDAETALLRCASVSDSRALIKLSSHFSPLFLFQNISILVVLMYSWQISVNMKKYQSLGDVYYGKAAGSTRIP